MAFYGNITDMRNIHFQFDAMFSSRTELERAARTGTDHIFAGRFVLVKYDLGSSSFQGDILTGFSYSNEGEISFYSDKFCEHPYIFTTFSVPSETPTAANWDQYYYYEQSSNKYYKLPAERYFSEADISKYRVPNVQNNDNIVSINQIIQVKEPITGALTPTFYKCSGRDSGEIATWTPIILDADYDDYFINYQLDLANFQNSFDTRGYDATVWQKVYNEGEGSFVLICRLNTNAPAFELFPDKPAFNPTTPYIDAKSTDFLYRIHTPSMWGFQFKSALPVAEGGLSEQDVTFARTIYDSDGNAGPNQTTTIHADIFTNQAGTNIDEHIVNTSVPNEIKLEATGRSGRRYYNSNGEALSDQNDILELSIHMPCIGNMVANGYDVIYGYLEVPIFEDGNPNPIGFRYPRTTDLDWISGEQSDEIKTNGFENLKSHDLSTLAGVINTMHDRLGQIIIPLDRWLNPTDASYDAWIAGLQGKNYIYSYQTSPQDPVQFYRLAEEQNYVNPQTGTFKYVAINFSSNTAAYAPNSFYYLDSAGPSVLQEGVAADDAIIATLQIDGAGTYSPSRHYYKKSIANIAYTPIDVEIYEPHKYFLKDGTSYIRDNGLDQGNETSNSPTNPYGQYYYIDERPQNVVSHTFYLGYSPNEYYYRENNTTNYLLSRTADPNGAIEYNTIAVQPIESTPILIYQPNLFYYTIGENSQHYIPITDATYETFRSEHQVIVNDSTFKLFWLEFEDTPIVTAVQNEQGAYETFLSYPVKDGGAHEIDYNETPIEDYPTALVESAYDQLARTSGVGPINRTIYCRSSTTNYDYIAYENTSSLTTTSGIPYYATPRQYYAVVLIPQNLYVKGRYYIRTPDDRSGNYSICWDDDVDININYYTINEIVPVLYPFYEPNKYWYEYATDDFRQDTTPAFLVNHTYHQEYTTPSTALRRFAKYLTKQRLYVENDSSGRCPVGYEWNEDSVYIPASVTLKALVTQIVLKEMKGFNNGSSSINGAILHLEQEYNAENKTRDTSTFRGGLNKLQDLLYTIDKLQPGHVVYVNDFGQLTTGDLTYAQLAALVH